MPVVKICDVCGSLATTSAIDMKEGPPVDGWATYKPFGVPRFGCDEHPVKSREIPYEDGAEAGR